MEFEFIDNNDDRRAPDPECATCSSPIGKGQEMVFHPAGWIHLRCAGASNGVAGKVAAFLRASEGRAFCSDCLGNEVGVSGDEVRQALWSVRARGRFRVEPAVCTGCGKLRVTLKAQAVA